MCYQRKKMPKYIPGDLEISSDEENSYEESYSKKGSFLKEQFWGGNFENVFFERGICIKKYDSYEKKISNIMFKVQSVAYK